MAKFKECVCTVCTASEHELLQDAKVHFILQDDKSEATDKSLITIIMHCSVILNNINQRAYFGLFSSPYSHRALQKSFTEEKKHRLALRGVTVADSHQMGTVNSRS